MQGQEILLGQCLQGSDEAKDGVTFDMGVSLNSHLSQLLCSLDKLGVPRVQRLPVTQHEGCEEEAVVSFKGVGDVFEEVARMALGGFKGGGTEGHAADDVDDGIVETVGFEGEHGNEPFVRDGRSRDGKLDTEMIDTSA